MHSIRQVIDTKNLLLAHLYPILLIPSVTLKFIPYFFLIIQIFTLFSLFEKPDVRRTKLNDRYGSLCNCNLCKMDGAEQLEIENSRLKRD
jgi:hypothetical protein